MNSRIITLTLALILVIGTAKADEPRYSISGGFGGYSSGMFFPKRSSDLGPALMFAIKYKTPVNFDIGLRLMHANNVRKLGSNAHPAYEGQKHTWIYNQYRFTISRAFKLGKSQEISVGTGVAVLIEETTLPNLYIGPSGPVISHGYLKFQELGLDISLEYKYVFDNNFFVGAHVSSILDLSFMVDGLLMTPTVGVKF